MPTILIILKLNTKHIHGALADKTGIKKEGKGLSLAFCSFQIIYAVICYFDFFFDDFLFFFNVVCALHKAIMLVYALFQTL